MDEEAPQNPVNPMGMIKNMAQKKFDPKMIAAIAFAIILIITALGLGFGIMRIDPAEPTVAGSSGSIVCNDWTAAEPGYQSTITNFANKVGIQPALLGAIFLDEHDNRWPQQGMNDPWASGGNGRGPFQIEEWDKKWSAYVNRVAAERGYTAPKNPGADKATFDDSALLAGSYLRVLAKSEVDDIDPMTTNENEIKCLAAAYNSGPEDCKKWRANNYTGEVNTTDDYHLRTWTSFQDLYVGCVNNVSSTNKYKSLSQIKMLYGSTESEVKKHIVTTTFMGKSVPVNKVLVDPLKKAENQIKSTGANYIITDLSGFFWRVNANDSSKISMHSFGLAIDINPLDNPNGARPPESAPRDSNKCTHKIPDNYVKALEDNGFFWGAKFKSYCDAMHFQYGGNAY